MTNQLLALTSIHPSSSPQGQSLLLCTMVALNTANVSVWWWGASKCTRMDALGGARCGQFGAATRPERTSPNSTTWEMSRKLTENRFGMNLVMWRMPGRCSLLYSELRTYIYLGTFKKSNRSLSIARDETRNLWVNINLHRRCQRKQLTGLEMSKEPIACYVLPCLQSQS